MTTLLETIEKLEEKLENKLSISNGLLEAYSKTPKNEKEYLELIEWIRKTFTETACVVKQ